MKTLKILAPLLFLGFLLSSGIVKEDILGKWILVKMVNKNGNQENLNNTKGAYLDFKTDGVLEMGEGTKSPQLGEWDYNPENKKLYVSEKPERQDEVIVKKLTKKKLKLYLVRRKRTIHLVRAN
ncbi:MAG: hypothetical protein ACI837_003185 [Crocinitomicaceae bacterium]|jgi:hypothetical protein